MKLPVRFRGTNVAGLAAGVVAGTLGASGVAHAGGLFFPGTGPVSTQRAGAAVASADDGEALVANPAGLAKATGTTISLGSNFVSYTLGFTRSGTYDHVDDADLPWEGDTYSTIFDDSKPKIGLGPFQALPLITIVSDLGGKVPGLHVGAGIVTPNAYPTRDLGSDYVIDDPNTPPPPTRYDVVEQDASIIPIHIAAAYRINKQLDVGARFTYAMASLKSTTYVWGVDNYEEWTGHDSVFKLDAKDNFVPGYGFGVTYRPLPQLEIGANFIGPLNISAKGDAISTPSGHLDLGGVPITITPPPDDLVRCEKGGTVAVLRGCAEVQVPMAAALGASYKFFDRAGRLRGDIELDEQWENWSAERATDVLVVVDGYVNNSIALKDNLVRHGFQDVFSTRLGGSYRHPLNTQDWLIARGGLAYDTSTAKDGWERVDFDGAARFTLAGGLAYHTKKFELTAGGGAVLEGTRTMAGSCNPTQTDKGCAGTNSDAPIDDRTGPDPIDPVLEAPRQRESPINQGTYQSHYAFFMVGGSFWF